MPQLLMSQREAKMLLLSLVLKYSELVALETTLVRHLGPDAERYAADNLPCSEDSHIVHHQSNVCQAVATDSANELSRDVVVDDGTAYYTSHAEHELSELNRDSVMETEKLDAKNADEQVAEPFDDILSESLSSIACGVGKSCSKPRYGELTVKSKQPRKVANLAAMEQGMCLVNASEASRLTNCRKSTHKTILNLMCLLKLK